MNFNVGDYVTRNSYGNDVIFIIMEIKDDIAILKGFDVRLVATAALTDLRYCREEDRKDEFFESLSTGCCLDRGETDDFFYLPAKILHLDAVYFDN